MTGRNEVMPVLFELAEKLEPEHGITIAADAQQRPRGRGLARSWRSTTPPGRSNWGFVPLTDEEIVAYAKELKPILDENWAMVAEKDGETVGVALTLPDYNQVLKQGERPPAAVRLAAASCARARRSTRSGSSRWASSPSTSTPASPPVSTSSTSTSAARDAAELGRDGLDPRVNDADEPRHGGDGRTHREELPDLREGARRDTSGRGVDSPDSMPEPADNPQEGDVRHLPVHVSIPRRAPSRYSLRRSSGPFSPPCRRRSWRPPGAFWWALPPGCSSG